MGVLAKIAYRNLRQHKTKTFIIGSLIALGMLILVVGNSVLDTATAGIKANYTENYTGHVIVAASGVEAPALTPDGAARSLEEGTPSLPDYETTIAFLESYGGVESVNPVITGFAMTQQDGEGSTALIRISIASSSPITWIWWTASSSRAAKRGL